MSTDTITGLKEHVSFAMRKGDPLAARINEIIMKIQESGVLERISNKYIPRYFLLNLQKYLGIKLILLF